MARVAINGLSRIGRATFKIILDTPKLEVIAVNDLVPPDNLAYLLKYDTVYGRYERKVESGNNSLVVDGQNYRVLSEKGLSHLPWGGLRIDIVFECTGAFTKKEELEKHIQAGAKNAILSAPSKRDEVITTVHGVNKSDNESTQVISCASCPTNCVSPIVEIMGRGHDLPEV